MHTSFDYTNMRIQGLFDSVFGAGFDLRLDLPIITRKTKKHLFSCLWELLTEERRTTTRKAAFFLFGDLDADLERELDLDDYSFPRSFAFAQAVLRMLAIVSSDEYRAVFSFYVYSNTAKIDALLRAGQAEGFEPLDDLRKTFIDGVLTMLHQAFKEFDAAVCQEPVKCLDRKDIDRLSEQYKQNPYHQQREILLSIDPQAEPEQTLGFIRKMLFDIQAESRADHNENWSAQEREFYGDEYISAMDPTKFYIYKTESNKSRSAQKFIDLAFHGLLLWELKRHLKKNDTEILRRFFNVDETNYFAKNQEKDRLIKRTENLIDNALSGLAMQS